MFTNALMYYPHDAVILMVYYDSQHQATALFGKWHLGFYQRAYTPLARGFDEHMGYFQGTTDYYTHDGYGYGGTPGGLDWHRGTSSVS